MFKKRLLPFFDKSILNIVRKNVVKYMNNKIYEGRSTSSQVTALPESMKCCKERWKIDERFTDFALPLGIVVYMPNGAILLGSTVWVLTYMSLGGVSPLTLVRLVLWLL